MIQGPTSNLGVVTLLGKVSVTPKNHENAAPNLLRFATIDLSSTDMLVTLPLCSTSAQKVH